MKIKFNRGVLKNKKFLIGVGLVAILAGLLFFFLALPLSAFYRQSRELASQGGKIKIALQQKNLAQAKIELKTAQGQLAETTRSYNKLGWLRVVPIARNYYADGTHLLVTGDKAIDAATVMIKAVEPYQDFLGVGGQAEGPDKTTEDRIGFLVKTISEVNSHLDKVEKDVSAIRAEVAQIDPGRYPEEFRGVAVRKQISQAQTLTLQLSRLLSQGRPLVSKADWLLGKDSPRYYLFLFQNDGELRPTGGFWTAYGILKVDKGKVTPIVSNDIYNLDRQFGNRLPPPRPIKAYHKNVTAWHLRDMNLSPDFAESIKTFMKNYQTIRKTDQIDGVFAVDTQVLVNVLDVMGGIGVPGWGNFLPKPDDRCFGCPQVVYQLELLADKPRTGLVKNRKGFLAPLMHSIIANALGSPKEKITPLAQTVWKDLETKHILAYFMDDDLNTSINALGFGGRIVDSQKDYLHINDSNFGGAKSNLFIRQKVKQEYQKKGGKIVKTVTVEYNNPAPASNCNLEAGKLCLNGLYRDWFRFYVPKGSKLVKMTGSEVDPVVYDELGKTVFEGFFGDTNPLYPKSKLSVSVQYELPFSDKSFDLLIQKQPGKRVAEHEIFVNGDQVEQLSVDEDTKTLINL